MCLRQWIGRTEFVQQQGQVTTYNWKAFHCELCHARYPDSMPNPNLKDGYVELFIVKRPLKNYIILESYLHS
jgi:hypothetical protein